MDGEMSMRNVHADRAVGRVRFEKVQEELARQFIEVMAQEELHDHQPVLLAIRKG
jgi:hypothetical protein